MLTCLHSFCKKCVEKDLEEKGADKSISCPTCEVATAVPEGGVNALPQDLRRSYESEVVLYEKKVKSKTDTACDQCISETNGSAVAFCVNCCEFLCRACKTHHKTWRKTVKHELVDLGEETKKKTGGKVFLDNIPHKAMFCSVHEDENLKFYCETCMVLICRDCVVLKHVGHTYNRMEEIAETEKVTLLSMVEEAEKAKAKLEDALARGGKAKQRVQTKQKEVDDSIAHIFQDLRKHIDKREEEVLAIRARIGLGKTTALTIQCERLKRLKDDIDETCEMIRTAAKIYTPAEVLSTKQTMAAKLDSLLALFKECPLDPCRTDFIATFLDSTSLTSDILSFGDISGGSDQSASFASVNLPRAIVGKERKIKITACYSNGKQFPIGGEEVKGTLALMGSDDPPIIGEVKDNEDGTYELSITPQKCGEHNLEITIESRPIKLMPIAFHCREPRAYTSLTSLQATFSCSGVVYDAAVDVNGDVYAAVYGRHCVQVFNASCSKIRTIGNDGSPGSGEGQLTYPNAIAIRGDRVYIAEYNNHRVSKFDLSGKFVSMFGSNGSGEGQFSRPHGVCFDQSGRLFVADHSNNRVSVFSSGDGTFAYNITGNGLSKPWGLAFDPSDNLHVTCFNSGCVKVFTADGKYLEEYGNNALKNPTGIAIDEEGYSIVTDYYNSNTSYCYSHFHVFDPEHKKVHSVQNFKRAYGVALDKDGCIYIADHDNRVMKY